MAESPHKTFPTVLVLDFGSQYTHLIIRRLRELHIYSEMHPCTASLASIPFKPAGIILSGGPNSVYSENAPHADPKIWEAGVPVLGICYGLQEMAWHFGGKGSVAAGTKREYGNATLATVDESKGGLFDSIFDGTSPNEKPGEDPKTVWMSHGDKLAHLPPDFTTIATTANAPFAGITHTSKPYYGIQFHPEVTHTKRGTSLLSNFALKICNIKPEWTMDRFVDQEIARIRETVGPKGQVIGAVSGGVDSTVAAKLMHEAIGDRFHAVLVDNGLLRKDEAAQVQKTLGEQLGINLTVVDASEMFLDRLKGVVDNPEKKRKIIGNTFIDVFLSKAKELEAEAKDTPHAGEIEFLLQGTLYPDVIESISFRGPSETIKTHHNVGGLPEKMDLKLIEPLRELFKDEVRALGQQLGIPDPLIWRHPFPGPGLGVRILGEVTPERVHMLQEADAIFIEEIRKVPGLYRSIAQALAALDPTRAVGVMGDKRVYGHIILLRAVDTKDFMTADWFPFSYDLLRTVSTRIVNEVDGVARVMYDVTNKPPGTIEFE